MEDADIAVLAVPFTAVDSAAQEIRDAAAGKIVIDATNPVRASRPTDRSGLAAGERSAAEELRQLLPDSAVVKAFNTVLASKQAQPVTDEGIINISLNARDHWSWQTGWKLLGPTR